MAGLFILFLGATVGFAVLPTDWGQDFADVAPGTDALTLTFRFLLSGVLMVVFTGFTLITGGGVVIGSYRLYVDHKAAKLRGIQH